MSTQRAHPRYATSLSAEVNDGQEMFTARARNLSIGGVGLELDRPIEQRALVAVSLFLVEDGIEDASGITLEIQGQVIWVARTDRGSYEGGVRFAPLLGAQAALLQRFIQRLQG